MLVNTLLSDWLAVRAQTTPHALALVTPEGRWTYAQIYQQTEQLVAKWQASGVRQGDIVAIKPQATLQSFLAIWSVLRLEAVLLLLNTRLTAHEQEAQLQAVHCQWVAEGSDLARMSSSQERIDTALHPFVILFTSGTSGVAKPVLLTKENFFASALASAYHLGALPSDRWLCVLPLYHVGGLSILFRCCLYGSAVQLLPRFDAQQVNTYLAENATTLVSLVPTMLYRMLALQPNPEIFASLRLILLGGAAPDAALIQQARDMHLPIATTYGLTEACSQVATALPDTVTRKGGTAGHALPFYQIAIVDENGEQLPYGREGEIIVKSPSIMVGYLYHAEATHRVLRDGWLYTGDIGYLDQDNDLWVLQRRSDLIISGGENIYPAEIEAVLKTHPLVRDACVVGIPDEEWGQRPVGMVAASSPHLTKDALLAFCAEKLARYKLPRDLMLVEALPLTESGKVARQQVKAMLVDGLQA